MSLEKLVIVSPETLTDAKLVSSNVPEDDYPEWAAGTFAKGARVIVTAKHRVYESTADGNTDNPTTPTAEPKWLEVGPTNRWRAFDESINSQTVQSDLITYTIKPGKATPFIGFMNLVNVSSVRVEVVDPVAGTVYDQTKALRNRLGQASWWTWFFGQRSAQTQAFFNDLSPYKNAEINITITGGADMAVGVILFGRQSAFSMGVHLGARLGIQDYSRKERNDFGDTIIVQRAFARRASFSMWLNAGEVDAFYDFLSSVRAKPCLWIGSDKYESTTVYGFYKSFDIIVSYPEISDCELELEGLT